MSSFNAVNSVPNLELPQSDGILLVIGEVFEKGYINGLISAAIAQGMSVVYTTMGKRDATGQLRPLNETEISEKGQEPLINIPLEAGFDLDVMANGQTIVGSLKGIKMSSWKEASVSSDAVGEARLLGENRFRAALRDVFCEVEKLVAKGSHVIVAHTMAGGFPRAKIVMPIANRVFKGVGDRYASSKEFWESGLGRLCEVSFQEVTAESFKYLIEESADWKLRLEGQGGSCSYLAYGYHGNEILVNGKYQWHTYAPYLQGFAKKRLETVAAKAQEEGVRATVFNCPEILTNSTSIFLGVEVALYPLISALKKEGGENARVKAVLNACSDLLAKGHSLVEIEEQAQAYLATDIVQDLMNFSLNWPPHNAPEQMAKMRVISSQMIEIHQDKSLLITSLLSEVVVESCGKIMLAMAESSDHPRYWLGHEVVAKAYL